MGLTVVGLFDIDPILYINVAQKEDLKLDATTDTQDIGSFEVALRTLTYLDIFFQLLGTVKAFS